MKITEMKSVITHSPSELSQNQVVAIHQFSSAENDGGGTGIRLVSPPLAVGRMAVSGHELKVKREADEKGKAVLVLHTWQDNLWEMGQKGDVPPGTQLDAKDRTSENQADENVQIVEQKTEATREEEHETNETDSTSKVTYTSQEITDLLTRSLVHGISVQLSSLPKSSFPIPSSQFYANYILPCRPAYPTSVLMPAAALAYPDAEVDPAEIHIDPSDITIKASSHKSLSTFLKAAEKSSLLSLKLAKQKSGGDLIVTSVNTRHPEVLSAKPYVTIAEIEAKRAKKQAREEKERERSEREVEVRQVWKPHLISVGLFKDMGAR